jgi:hypothetical protein
MIQLRRAKFCGWKIGIRTACPVLVDNLSSEGLDHIWSEISRINWEHRDDINQETSEQSSSQCTLSAKRRFSSRREA